MGSSNGGSDNDEAKVLPKLETEGEEKREVEGDTKGDSSLPPRPWIPQLVGPEKQ